MGVAHARCACPEFKWLSGVEKHRREQSPALQISQESLDGIERLLNGIEDELRKIDGLGEAIEAAQELQQILAELRLELTRLPKI